MIFSAKDKLDFVTKFVENIPQTQGNVPLPDATRRRILNSTVRLFAHYGGDDDAKKTQYKKDLNASGVVFNFQGSKVLILTAAHNLLIWAGLDQPPEDWTELEQDFAASLKVYYGRRIGQTDFGDLTFNCQPGFPCQATDVKVQSDIDGPYSEHVGQNQSPGYYDLALITCDSGEFARYVSVHVFPNNYNFLGGIVALLAETEKALSKRTKYNFILLGCGLTSEKRSKVTIQTYVDKDTKKTVHKIKSMADVLKQCEKDWGVNALYLHYRGTAPLFDSLTPAFDVEKPAVGQEPAFSRYPHTIALSAKSGTSAEGDSGGPLYAISCADPNKVYLLGVTTGSDMELTEKAPVDPYSNDISTSVLPYFETFRPKEKPAGAGAKPAGAGAKPADAIVKPADAGATPADAVVKPADAGATPVDAVVKPADAGATPVDAVVKPANVETKPADTGAKPQQKS